jgi:hypothetical protein
MRRLIAFGVVSSVFLTGFVFGGVRASSAPPTREALDIETVRPAWSESAVTRIRDIQEPRCDPGSQVDRYVRCLNRYLSRLANGVNEAIGTFEMFFKCTNYLQITQYGDPAGSAGYVYNNNDGTGEFFTSSLDITFDVTTDPFLNAYVVKPTEACIEFAQ